MSRVRTTLTVCLAAWLVTACEPETTAPPPPARVASAPHVAANWHPTNPDGSPDLSAETVIEGEYALATLTGSAPIFSAQVTAGYWLVGSVGSIMIVPELTKNRGQTVQTSPHYYPISVPTAAIAKYETTWSQPVDGYCEMRLGGWADFTAAFRSNNVEWGRKLRTGTIPPNTAGPTCVAPTVSISPAGTVTVAYGESQSFTATVTPGSGGTASTQWYVDGTPQGSGNDWVGSFGPGVHSVSFVVTNGAGLGTTSNTVTVVQEVEEVDEELESCDGIIVDDASSCEGDGDGGGGGGGGGGGNDGPCEVWLFTLRLSNDGGATWRTVSTWYEYINC